MFGVIEIEYGGDFMGVLLVILGILWSSICIVLGTGSNILILSLIIIPINIIKTNKKPKKNATKINKNPR